MTPSPIRTARNSVHAAACIIRDVLKDSTLPIVIRVELDQARRRLLEAHGCLWDAEPEEVPVSELTPWEEAQVAEYEFHRQREAV
ncbi:MAG TPA: hypothetical protein VGU45_01505 [Microvirga sp.]|jgi:hypothetical protein|nr:hypothetical protein [Microvirga sp.]